MEILAALIRPFLHRLGVDIIRYRPEILQDISDECRSIYLQVKDCTMTGPLRVNALVEAVRYVHEAAIPGDIVECGVWKGGSAMAIAQTLINLGDSSRKIYLYDTFAGMSAPTENDVSYTGEPAEQYYQQQISEDGTCDWCISPLDEVKGNVLGTGYTADKIHFIQGKVEETIPETIPERIALLRLDTDWYESTRHELVHLFPRLEKNGVLIIDDYGHWQGARKAVDEYFAEHDVKILLNRIDYTGRVAIKTG